MQHLSKEIYFKISVPVQKRKGNGISSKERNLGVYVIHLIILYNLGPESEISASLKNFKPEKKNSVFTS